MEHTDMIVNTPTITVEALVDPVVEAHGYDPRSLYVETFYAGIIGPTSLLLMRRLATGLEAHPNGFRLDAAATAVGLGLGEGLGRNSPWVRTLRRLARFELCQLRGSGRLAVRRALAPLPPRQCHRLPLALQRAHDRWPDVEGAPHVVLGVAVAQPAGS